MKPRSPRLTMPIVALVLLSGSFAGGSGPGDRVVAEREAAACGPRAAYLLLSHLGVPSTYSNVRESIALSDQGASIAELRQCLRSYGISCSVRRLDPSEMLAVRAPMIAYLSHLYVGNGAGHFVFIPSMLPGGPETIDPVTGLHLAPWGWQSFCNAWSGVCLVVERPSIRNDLPLVITFANLGLLLALGYVSASRRFFGRCDTTAPPSASGPLGGKLDRSIALASCRHRVFHGILLCVLTQACAGRVRAEGDASRDGLRSGARQGANAAALLLGCVTGDLGDLLADAQASAAMSMDDVRLSLRQRGFETVLRCLTMDELSRSAPSIVLIRDGPTRDGSYYLFLAVREDEVSLIRAGEIAVEVIAVDDFRYRWTGHALLPKPADFASPPRAGRLFAALSMGVLFSIAAAIVRITTAKHLPEKQQ